MSEVSPRLVSDDRQGVLPHRLATTRHPNMLELPARVWLDVVAPGARSLADVPDAALDAILEQGFDLVWLMGVWSTGARGRDIAAGHEDLRRAYDAALPGWSRDDVVGSPYAIREYTVAAELGGNQALADLRRRLADRGLGLVLDYVPNHTAVDHPMVTSHPEFYVQCAPDEAACRPHDSFAVDTEHGQRFIEHGRDPYFPPWTDTAQVDIGHPGARAAQLTTLRTISDMCDGVRCDMAMLCLDDIFTRTWSDRPGRFDDEPRAEGGYWETMIGAIRGQRPGFLFIAEVYWGLESRLLEAGFDYAYDKVLYDRVRYDAAPQIVEHLNAVDGLGNRMVRFLENHDEDRAAAAFSPDKLFAALTAVYTLPGMRLFYDGQLDGARRSLPVQLRRRLPEEPDEPVVRFYERLLRALDHRAFRIGAWQRIDAEPAWEQNKSYEQIVTHFWDATYHGQRLVVVNLADSPAQGRIHIGTVHRGGKRIRLRDEIGPECFLRDRDELASDGLFLELEPYQAHIFVVESSS